MTARTPNANGCDQRAMGVRLMRVTRVRCRAGLAHSPGPGHHLALTYLSKRDTCANELALRAGGQNRAMSRAHGCPLGRGDQRAAERFAKRRKVC